MPPPVTRATRPFTEKRFAGSSGFDMAVGAAVNWEGGEPSKSSGVGQTEDIFKDTNSQTIAPVCPRGLAHPLVIGLRNNGLRKARLFQKGSSIRHDSKAFTRGLMPWELGLEGGPSLPLPRFQFKLELDLPDKIKLT